MSTVAAMPDSAATLPEPSIPPLLLLAEYWLAPDRFMDRCGRLGDRFVLRLPGVGTLVCLTHPEDVKRVFTGDQSALHLGAAVRRLGPQELVLGPTSITVLDGAEHFRRRRLQMRPFGKPRLPAYEAGMEEKTRVAMRDWPIGVPVSFHELMQRLTLEIIIATIFGVSDPERLARLRERVLHLIAVFGSARFLVSVIWALARGGRWTGRYSRMRAALAAVDAVVLEEVAERRRRGDLERDDVLSVLLQARYEDDAPMSDAELCETMRTLLLAGHETTASSLAWLAERVVRHPAVLERLESSVAAGDSHYLDAVIAEALRLRPVLPFTARLVVQPFELNGLRIEPGVLVAPFITLVHRRPDLYPDPLEFRPERFLAQPPPTYGWIPFGGGIRRCLGEPFAVLEMTVLMRTILRELRLRPEPGRDEPVSRRSITLVPGGRATVVLERRYSESTWASDGSARPSTMAR